MSDIKLEPFEKNLTEEQFQKLRKSVITRIRLEWEKRASHIFNDADYSADKWMSLTPCSFLYCEICKNRGIEDDLKLGKVFSDYQKAVKLGKTEALKAINDGLISFRDKVEVVSGSDFKYLCFTDAKLRKAALDESKIKINP